MTLKKTNNIMAQEEMGVQRANEDFLGRISRFLSSHQVEMKFPSAKILGGKNYISTKHFVCWRMFKKKKNELNKVKL